LKGFRHLFERTLIIAALAFGSLHIATAQLIYNLIKSVPPNNDPDSSIGINPSGVLLEGKDALLYGTMWSGGADGGTNGTVYQVNKDGSGYFVLYRFSGAPMDGSGPNGGLVQANDGSFYGTTRWGGISNKGTIFRLTNTGFNTYTNTVLRSFTGGDGANPAGRLLLTADGTLYGATTYGGITGIGPVYSNGFGTLFKLYLSGNSYIGLHYFTGYPNDGNFPVGSLVLGPDGMLYGTTSGGGSGQLGTVFRISTDGGSYTILRSFPGSAGDGYQPTAGLVGNGNGTFFGATTYGGGSYGTIFKINTNASVYSVLTDFYSMDPSAGLGKNPQGPLSLGTDGLLYGNTSGGGSNNFGNVFRLNTNGTGYTVLHAFSDPLIDFDARTPYAGPVQGGDGGFYGITFNGGDRDSGAIYSLGSRPTNNNFANRIALAGATATGKGNNLNATLESGEPFHGVSPNLCTNSVWWSWSGLSDGLVTIVNTNPTMNATLDVYRDTPNGCLTPLSGLADWWPANGDAVDVIGGQNGNISAEVGFSVGKVVYAFDFPGQLSPGPGRRNDIRVNATPLGPPWSAEFWVNRQDCLTNSAVLLGDTNVALKLEQIVGARQIGITVWGTNDFAFNYSAPTGTWVHLVFVASSTNVSLYTNGVFHGSIAATNINLPRGQLGNDIRGRFNQPLRGLVDEVSLYTRMLTALEIAALFNADAAGKCLSPTNVKITDLVYVANNANGSPNRVTFAATTGARYYLAVSGAMNTNGPNFAGAGDITLAARTLDLKVLSAAPTATNSTSSNVTFNTTIQIGSSRSVASTALRLQFVARAGFSKVNASNAPVSLPADLVLTNYVLNNPTNVAPGAATNVAIANLVCPGPTNYLYAGISDNIGWLVFVYLQQQVGTNWLTQDSDMVLRGISPGVVGSSPAPGGGVIRIEAVGGGGVSLSSVRIIGPTAVNEGSTNSYYGEAHFDEIGYIYPFTNTVWTSGIPAISGSGVFTPGIVTNTSQTTLTCYYTYDTTASANLAVWVTNLPPPILTNLVRLPNKQFQLSLKGVPGRKHVIQAATNLVSPVIWTNLATVTNNGAGTNAYIDSGATNFSRRFYRAFETQ
jgi:uncharacterized repeat protein (TIGR03803 family)